MRAYRDEAWLQAMVDRGLTNEEMGRKAGCSASAISYWRRRLGVEPSYRDEGWLREMVRDRGMTDEEIAEAWGCTRSTISTWRRRHGIRASRASVPLDEYLEDLRSVADDLGREPTYEEARDRGDLHPAAVMKREGLRWTELREMALSGR